jgi:hypothetical protein
MANNDESWLEQLSRVVAPVAVVAIASYGAWDLVIQPLLHSRRITEDTCSTRIANIFIEKPGSNPSEPSKKVKAPEDLPLVVPAGEQRPIIIEVENPESESAIYAWNATYGQFNSRRSAENRAIYTAPRKLINDKLTLEVTVGTCSTAKRTITIAVVPSASMPLEPLPSVPNSPTFPSSAPTPTPLSPTPSPSIP